VEETSSAMQCLTLTADENTENSSGRENGDNGWRGGGSYNSVHPVYRVISKINGKINRMDVDQLKSMCRQHGLATIGKREAIKRRLKEYIKSEKLIEAGLLDRKATLIINTPYFIVIDFEATCEERNPPSYPHEIIEFPAVLVSTEQMKIIDVFHSFVRPVINPKLSEFCRNLTGIEQTTVDAADPFPVVHDRFLAWMDGHGLREDLFTLVTDGPFDMGRFLYLQVKQCGLPYPMEYASHWANLRKSFANFYNRKGEHFKAVEGLTAAELPGLQQMLDVLGLTFEGIPHSGVDDARNIARILIKLLEDRAFVRVNERIINVDGPDTNVDRGGGRLPNVVPVTRKEAEELLQSMQRKAKDTPTQQQRGGVAGCNDEDSPQNLSAQSSNSTSSR